MFYFPFLNNGKDTSAQKKERHGRAWHDGITNGKTGGVAEGLALNRYSEPGFAATMGGDRVPPCAAVLKRVFTCFGNQRPGRVDDEAA